MKIGTAKIVDDSIIEKAKEKEHRDYLGASIVGDECERKVWYSYNYPMIIEDARVQRIFKLGQVIEDHIVVPMLKDAGFKVFEKDSNGKQFGFKDGKFAGNIDGVITGLPESSKPHLLEIKSANAKRFKQFNDNGYRATSSTYFTQIQIYMHYLKLERALVVVYNKDTSDLYFERIPYDALYAEMQIDKAHNIIAAESEPERAYSKSTFFKCRFCSYREKCWEL